MNLRIFTNTQSELQEIKEELKIKSEYNEFAQSILDRVKFHSYETDLMQENQKELKALQSCDVLIIEDDISVILKYFRVLEKSDAIKAIYVCTKMTVTKEIFGSFCMDRRECGIKLIILDFDLDETTDQDEKHRRAEELYKNLTAESSRGLFRIFAITAFENKPTKFFDLQNMMRHDGHYFDLVLNKQILNHEELLENLFRNVSGVFYNFSLTDKEKKVRSYNKDSSKTKLQAATQKSIRLDKAAKFLQNIELAIGNVAPRGDKAFILTEHFGTIRKLEEDKNTPFYSNASRVSKLKSKYKYKRELQYLLVNRLTLYPNIATQIERYPKFFLSKLVINRTAHLK